MSWVTTYKKIPIQLHVQEMEDNRAHLIVTSAAVLCKGTTSPSDLGLRGFRGLAFRVDDINPALPI